MTEAFDWLKPSLLWQADSLDFRQPDFFRPQLLEFRSDTFMEDFLAATEARKPDAFRQALAKPTTSGQPLKLFQPIHGCFYVLCSSLCCRVPGFPDRQVQTAEGESTFFVLRKLVNGAEYAWVVEGAQKGWRPLNGLSKRFMDGEERHPLSTTTAANGRGLVFGYLPVASRETYAVPPSELAEESTPTDTRLEELRARFVDPLRRPDPDKPSSIIETPDDSVALTLSVYLLLDLWEFFATPSHLPDVAEALSGTSAASFSGAKAQAKASLMTFLESQRLGGTLTLAGALRKVAQEHQALNQPGGGNLSQLGFNNDYNLKIHRLDTTTLTQLIQRVEDALPVEQPSVELPKLEPRADALYVLRCVYERPQCETTHVVSQPSETFHLAPFFDPEAPARPVHIPLPANVSIAGLRKFKKNVTFMMSDGMRRKVARITGQEKAFIRDDPPPLNAEEPADGLAHICSFSIQIIFIVAFFLLIMFVIILNFVFWWIAFFKICLPIPKRLLPG